MGLFMGWAEAEGVVCFGGDELNGSDPTVASLPKGSKLLALEAGLAGGVSLAADFAVGAADANGSEDSAGSLSKESKLAIFCAAGFDAKGSNDSLVVFPAFVFSPKGSKLLLAGGTLGDCNEDLGAGAFFEDDAGRPDLDGGEEEFCGTFSLCCRSDL